MRRKRTWRNRRSPVQLPLFLSAYCLCVYWCSAATARAKGKGDTEGDAIQRGTRARPGGGNRRHQAQGRSAMCASSEDKWDQHTRGPRTVDTSLDKQRSTFACTRVHWRLHIDTHAHRVTSGRTSRHSTDSVTFSPAMKEAERQTTSVDEEPKGRRKKDRAARAAALFQ